MVTKLLLELRPGDTWTGGDGVVGKAAELSPVAADGADLVLLHGSPATSEDWNAQPGALWVVEQGLDAAARLRGMFPNHRFLPHVQASRAAVRFSMGERYQGEGFRVYVPDTAALRGYQVDDGDEALTDWLHRAEAMGFDTVWLSGRDIAERGKGFDLELLDRAKRDFGGNVILSGGGVELSHLEALREEGGCFAAIVPVELAARMGLEAVQLALQPPAEAVATDGVAA